MIDCDRDPIASLLEMFVSMVQQGRIAKGQCPAMRPVFLKPHGVVHGLFRVRQDIPEELKVGVFAGRDYPVWARFSSDTLPTRSDFKTTLGIAIKLFGVPGEKIFGASADTTADFILQNSPVFFVDTAADMCAFTRAGVVEGDYGPYLAAHPETARILDDMAKPVASVLGSPYWSGVPFAFGGNRYVKYKLIPAFDAKPLPDAPADPCHLATDLFNRLKTAEARFVFCVQFQTDPARMPLDRATVSWSESESAPLPVADLILPQQDIHARGQATYGDNLSWNIWRVPAEHRPQGSLAEARRVVYAASADVRRNVNGVPTSEPTRPRPIDEAPACVDTTVVRAAIHPAIGIARIGDSTKDFFIGPEVLEPAAESPGFYRDDTGALKRQAARFRIFGFNAKGEVVRELTSQNALIEWTVHLANKKAQWYRFLAALDIPEAATMAAPRRNPRVPVGTRDALMIDPGPRSISGASASGDERYLFDTGVFKGTPVPLGEIRTDAAGRLLVLGGVGKSASPSGAPPFDPADNDSFNNADDWYDDTADGPVTAVVKVDSLSIPVEGAWIVVAPPNYAPGVVGWRTMHDLLVDVYTQSGWLDLPARVSFADDVLPVLRRLSNLQWVNAGFAALFGHGGPLNFDDPELIARLARAPDPRTNIDPHRELRQLMFNSFRPAGARVNDVRIWPWIYGDAYGSFAASSPNNDLGLVPVQEQLLRRWVAGDFIDDWDPHRSNPRSIEDISLRDRPATLDRAALHFCLADAFHPGCELTWPMRHLSLYEKPFRIRRRDPSSREPDYGPNLTQEIILRPDGPLNAQGPGDLTRWMAVPWQGDTAYCRSGYDFKYDPYVPTFWPARVPNEVLTEEDYAIVMNTTLSREERLLAFNRRPKWLRAVSSGGVAEVMTRVVAQFGALGIVEVRDGPVADPDFPRVMFVESLAGSELRERATDIARLFATPPRALSDLERAGWHDAEQHAEAQRARFRMSR
jgi:hypothetical protein